MAARFRAALGALVGLRHRISAAFILQSAACAVVAWSVMHGGITLAPPASPPGAIAESPVSTAPAGAIAPLAAPPSSSGAPSAPPPQTARAAPDATGTAAPPQGAEPPIAGTHSAPPSVQLAAVPTLAEARLALSTIDVIVTRNDTLDRIFRRLRLNL